MNDYLALTIGVVLTGLGGEAFLRGIVRLAAALRIAPAIVGATIAAFATSSPELSVGISSAIAGVPTIPLGNALGSNVVNIALIIGLALLFGRIATERKSIARNVLASFLVPIGIGVLAADGTISRLDGMLMLAAFLVWITSVTLEARRQRASYIAEKGGVGMAIIYGAIGLGMLVTAGRFIVSGATGIAVLLGLDNFIVGTVIVAIGTTVPELATVLISRMRGSDDIGVNTILGSVIFNGLFVVGIVSVISPIPVVWTEVSVAVLFGVVSLVAMIPSRTGYIQRWRAPVLLAMYVAYVTTILGTGAWARLH